MSGASPFAPPDATQIAADVERAFAEDLGPGDATAGLLPPNARAHAELTCRDAAVIAGTPWFDACFRRLDPAVQIDWRVRDGDRVAPGTVICRLSGHARSLVTAERSALNFLQLLSATATVTAGYVAATAGTAVRVLDTRKTIPGLRLAQKYAVRCGGGHNQRMGLYDAVLVKENHIIAAGSIVAAVQAARRLHPELLLEVEVENLDELEQALQAGVDRIMLDNFEPAQMREAVRYTAGRVPLEASGNIDLGTIGDYARTGVDFISVGALTKHVHAIDLSLRLQLD
ncbi:MULTISPECIES: carboxylating nicotinate-nucleotide diphosphorylase [Rhodanobacter]|uniref:carboxylating nicotinate-nucleotide diphosphorylase n=1 Tax=Rhodanobacter TaxID=75309 RepID=UPI0004146F0A|nr:MULTISPECIES: carboxylating nicotinate-nucleotide diphosphorylase [Rhodanobacter]KZC20331.1 nicotinate-nucleotide pyrophosphorylase [Rhodanobacter denitrificans]UJJ50126.1 carboxylating nicotinate-nucleotide diphosphorylase [Rhodanobacter denitrificans]UJM92841.1 carboxylating nicotinate-nucleotide diphosphorylase [Rhodanobacter denitrificans]UJM96371.1 carboxylating nicotinate-nucleotide diphosphorylase [Rhodanobacter denitrificans]UJN20798.1 carboxylating nicotinate-nucleotide diphosphory